MEKKKKIWLGIILAVIILIFAVFLVLDYSKGKHEISLLEAKKKYNEKQKECIVVGTTQNYIWLERRKEDSEKIAGAKWKVTTPEGKEVGSFETNEKGTGGLVGLPYGEYLLEEVSVPEGEVKEEKIYRVGITAYDTDYHILVSSQEKDGNLLLVVEDEEGMPVEGVSYDILDFEEKKILTVTTNQKGLAGVSNVSGIYFVQEQGKEETRKMVVVESPNIERMDITK